MLIGALAQYFFGISIFVSSIFLILLVLVQRGRGGGLTRALGGPGGQSAFGTKAGDLFTRITIGVAAAWIFLCASSVYFLRPAALPEQSGSAAATSGSAPGGMGGGLGDAAIDSEAGLTGELEIDDTNGDAALLESESSLPAEPTGQEPAGEADSIPAETSEESASAETSETPDDSQPNN